MKEKHTLMAKSRVLQTRGGTITLPTYIPVTTFGSKYPLDNLIRPYLPRLASAAMVSWHYAQQLDRRLSMPLFVDSGGFASLFEKNKIVTRKGLGILQMPGEDNDKKPVTLHPKDVLDLQEKVADVAFTLDFPIPPRMPPSQAKRRSKLTIANALWALENRRRKDLLLFACIQGWDADSVREVARSYKQAGFDGVAIGGLVPRARDIELVTAIVSSVRDELPDLPLHVFGLGKPDLVAHLFNLGVDSVDSTAYVKLAADGRLWGQPDFRFDDPSPTDRLHLAMCNLATATQTTLPLSAFRIAFDTISLSNAKRSFSS